MEYNRFKIEMDNSYVGEPYDVPISNNLTTLWLEIFYELCEYTGEDVNLGTIDYIEVLEDEGVFLKLIGKDLLELPYSSLNPIVCFDFAEELTAAEAFVIQSN